MHRGCRERFPRHRLQRKLLVSDPGMHHSTCVTHVPWCMSGSLTRGGGENVPRIPSACVTHNFTYLARGPLHIYQSTLQCLCIFTQLFPLNATSVSVIFKDDYSALSWIAVNTWTMGYNISSCFRCSIGVRWLKSQTYFVELKIKPSNLLLIHFMVLSHAMFIMEYKTWYENLHVKLTLIEKINS